MRPALVLRRALALLLLTGLVAAGGGEARGAGHINVIQIRGSINPASSDHIQTAITTSEIDGAHLLLIELDTPGGLLSSTKDIIQGILNASVPVVVYVAPRGAWAASAGTFITLAGHVAAMAPGTSIGAAHPVAIGGGGGAPPAQDDEDSPPPRDFAAEKAENFAATFMESIANERDRNAEWAVQAVRESVAIGADEALEKDVIDLVAADRRALLEAIDGREVEVAGAMVTLDTAGARQIEIEMTLVNRVIDVLASPDIAVLLILAGLLGLYVEVTQPGGIVPGVVGAVCLVLGFVALQILPFSWLGLLLLVGGTALFVAELFVTSYGLLFAAGVICFLIGGSMIFDMPEVSDLDVSFYSVLLPMVGTMSLLAAMVIYAVGRSVAMPAITGAAELVGMLGRVETPLAPEGQVFVRGELWAASADEPLAAGDPVEVTAVDGLKMRVRRAPRADSQ